MTEQWDGYPEDPDNARWCWLIANTINGPQPELACWFSCSSIWLIAGNEQEFRPDQMWPNGWPSYIGPCLTPAEVEARATTARREVVEQAIEIVERTISPWSIVASDECAAALRDLLKGSE